jgi:hypothetical protein
MKSLERDRNERYSTALAMRNDLEAWLREQTPAPTRERVAAAMSVLFAAAREAIDAQIQSQLALATRAFTSSAELPMIKAFGATGESPSRSQRPDSNDHRVEHRSVRCDWSGERLARLDQHRERPARIRSRPSRPRPRRERRSGPGSRHARRREWCQAHRTSPGQGDGLGDRCALAEWSRRVVVVSVPPAGRASCCERGASGDDRRGRAAGVQRSTRAGEEAPSCDHDDTERRARGVRWSGVWDDPRRVRSRERLTHVAVVQRRLSIPNGRARLQ